MRDIDLIIEKVKQQLSDVQVWQINKTHPSDDDGLWHFSFPNIKPDIQIESNYGMCPFIVETNERCCDNARKAHTVDGTVSMIVDYLKLVSSHK